MVGGFPGGEVGLKLFVKTGEVPKTRPATVGPIGGSLGILVRSCRHRQSDCSTSACAKAATFIHAPFRTLRGAA